MEEKWKLIEGSDIHEISNFGKVRRVDNKKPVKLTKDSKNYLQAFVVYNHRKKGYTKKVHSLVMQHFGEERPEGYVIDHIDDDKNNNRIDNLKYVTNRYNTLKQKLKDNPNKIPGIKKGGKSTWCIELRVKGTQRHSKCGFKSEQEAFKYYKEFIIKLDPSVEELLINKNQ